ncbi:flagellar hook-basal body complex protein FliE [Amphibacillus marinus]|uniref:Flagellar hook-basal body complex protein FliE n=1 Tax=Amphibacillus marinus TaxID=872970 RepID=A0A1H8HSS8_9BACI|nr:flagellar hook-basal body complex protein FliE [Amphibacillus marinus]SEN59189.1 flagellar hook-basal body complex protein FliE [Amphibacillus marinus]
MNVGFLQNIQPLTTINSQAGQNQRPQAQFASELKDAIHKLNQEQVETEIKTEKLVNGEIDDLHDVMITAQKSAISMNLAVEIQSKVIDSYNEIMRMQL